MPFASSSSFSENLIEQFLTVAEDEKEELIGLQIIGSLEEDGYLRRELQALLNDLAFTQNVECDIKEGEEVLKKIQTLDPAGIAARNLQECLLIQLRRKENMLPEIKIAITIIQNYMDDFIKKHYDRLCRNLELKTENLKKIIEIITKLNPRPGEAAQTEKSHYIIPDFVLSTETGKIEVSLNSRNAPELRLSRSYIDTLKTYDKNPAANKHMKDSVHYIKQKLDSAKWFIENIKQRHNTLLSTMMTIAHYQKEFFFSGDETTLKPMILKDIAERTGLDISTISRVASSKYVETEFGIFALKFFFSEGVTNSEGEESSSREIKKILKNCIAAENKKKPVPDEKLMEILHEKGYMIARRTVAKYREQLGIPVARLRKEL